MREGPPCIYVGAYISNSACIAGSSGGYAYSSRRCRCYRAPQHRATGGIESVGAPAHLAAPEAVYAPCGTRSKPPQKPSTNPKPRLSEGDMGRPPLSGGIRFVEYIRPPGIPQLVG